MRSVRFVGTGLLLVTVASCATSRTSSQPSSSPTPRSIGSPLPAESAVPIESNPPGDIPDSTQFVDYMSAAGGYHLKTPEGWSRTAHGTSVRFTDKLTSIAVDIVHADRPRTPTTARTIDEPQLRRTVRAFEEVKVETVSVPGGPTVLLRYRANSVPNDVTGKSVRLEVDRYEISATSGGGRLAILSLAAPAGSDNVDVWRLVSRSFGWSG